MSVRTMARVWQDSLHSGTDLLMLLAIADFADDEGNAYPAVSTLAKKCRTGPRNAQYVLKSLEESGELRLFRGKGPRGTNRYRITLKGVQAAAPLQSPAPLQPSSPEGCNTVREGVHPAAPKPSLTINEPPKRRPPVATSPRVVKRVEQSLVKFLEDCLTGGTMAIAEDDPIYTYAELVGIHVDMLAVCWGRFKAYYTGSGNGCDKRQKDWRAHYRNAVRDNWYKLWYLPAEGDKAVWTTAGEQGRREMAAAAAEARSAA